MKAKEQDVMNETSLRQSRSSEEASLWQSRQGSSANLADVLERVLDKGLIIAGDIKINLLDIELLTIKLRLLVCTVDKAKEMGIDWWEHDPSLSRGAPQKLAAENERLRERVRELETVGPEVQR